MATHPLTRLGILTATYTVLHCLLGGNYGELATKNGVKKVAVLSTSFARDLVAASSVVGLIASRLKIHPSTCIGAFFLTFAALKCFEKTRVNKDDPVKQICFSLDIAISSVVLLTVPLLFYATTGKIMYSKS